MSASDLRAAGQTGAQRTSFRRAEVHCVCSSEFAPALQRIYDERDWAFDELRRQAGARLLSGRRELVAARLAGTPVLVKRLYHGGLLGFLTRDRFLTARRFRNHLRCADYLLSHAVLTPRVLFVAWRRDGAFARGEIGVEFLPGSLDASGYLFEGAQGLPEDWRERVREIGALVARLHQLRVHHGDLNLRNFLLSPERGIFILDLDKATMARRRLTRLVRRHNLARLEHSVRKQGRSAPAEQVESIVSLLRAGYRSGDA
jgi:tRNA A-37 threonylcarbamoyl transferase component Bud32